MDKRSKRTGGEWIVDDRHIHRADGLTYPPDEQTNDLIETDLILEVNTDGHQGGLLKPTDRANLKTAALAGTTANKLDAMGYDGDACIEALPELLKACDQMMSAILSTAEVVEMDGGSPRWDRIVPMTDSARALLSRLRPAKGGER